MPVLFSGFYIRHARGITMRNVRVAMKQEDARPAFLLDDVHGSNFDDIRTESVSKTPPFSIDPNCTDVGFSSVAAEDQKKCNLPK
jgi:hypothetical protein